MFSLCPTDFRFAVIKHWSQTIGRVGILAYSYSLSLRESKAVSNLAGTETEAKKEHCLLAASHSMLCLLP